MKRHLESHVDHVSADVLAYVLDKFGDCTSKFTVTFKLPEVLKVECGLYGPIMGDAPLTEADVFYGNRGERITKSRLCNRPKRPTNLCTVIAGPYDGEDCVLFTVFGGPLTPRETDEPGLSDVDKAISSSFWSLHALSA